MTSASASQARFIGVVCGLKAEARAICAAADEARVRVAVSGASAERAEKMAAYFCHGGAKAILSVGVSGGLAPHLKPGDLLIGDAVRTKAGEEFAASSSLIAAFEMEAAATPLERAILFGADEIVASAREKAQLFERYTAAAVDMESHGAARAARAGGVPFAAIRAIADPAGRALPRAALNAVAPDGSTRTLAVLLECAKAPGQFPALMQLGSDSEAALKSLRGGLGGLFRRLLLSLDL
jgi:hopanoid-associated phosphorylase